MVDVKTAVASAEAYLKSFPNLLQIVSPRLEETEVDPDSGDWLITISFADDPNSLTQMLTQQPRRTYRQLRVDKSTGHVVSMKHRSFAEA